MLFLGPQVRDSYKDWEQEARTFVAYLGLISGKYPDDSRLVSSVGELSMKDADFASMGPPAEPGNAPQEPNTSSTHWSAISPWSSKSGYKQTPWTIASISTPRQTRGLPVHSLC